MLSLKRFHSSVPQKSSSIRNPPRSKNSRNFAAWASVSFQSPISPAHNHGQLYTSSSSSRFTGCSTEVADTVDLASSASGDSSDMRPDTMSVWEICELMKYLQDDPTGDQDRLVRLEWRLLPLARHDHFVPKILHSELSRNPGFFVEVLTAIFRSKNEPKEENEKADPAKQALWQAAYHLLDSWTGIPGKKPRSEEHTSELQSLR